MTGELLRPEVGYRAEASVLADGVGVSLETTTWRGISAPPLDARVGLDGPCRAALDAYVTRVGRMSFGLFGPPRSGEPSLTLRPIGLTLMRFGGPHHNAPGDLHYTVESGLLATNHPRAQKVGKLCFRWWREGADEFFQTEVRDYHSMLVGRSANFLQRSFYSLTQMNMHRLVMWRFHVWVQSARQDLISKI